MNEYDLSWIDQKPKMGYHNGIGKPVFLNREAFWLCYSGSAHPEVVDLVEWEWDDSYLSPHLNKRFIETASNVQVRKPINSKSLYGWKKYSDLLKPAFELLRKEEIISNLIKKK